MKPHFFTSKARMIGITNRSVSGAVPDIGSYESSLERDFMELTRFDKAIHKVVPQPLTLNYFDRFGVERPYTPDGLVYYQKELQLSPLLYEIKYRSDLIGQSKKLLPKVREACSVARIRGWQFRILTEYEIRTPYLANAKFLWGYKDFPVEEAVIGRVLRILEDLESVDVDLLLCALYSSKSDRAKGIPVIWHLIAQGIIWCDLDLPLTMKTVLRIRGEQ